MLLQERRDRFIGDPATAKGLHLDAHRVCEPYRVAELHFIDIDGAGETRLLRLRGVISRYPPP